MKCPKCDGLGFYVVESEAPFCDLCEKCNMCGSSGIVYPPLINRYELSKSEIACEESWEKNR